MPEREPSGNQNFTRNNLVQIGLDLAKRNPNISFGREEQRVFESGRWSKIAKELRRLPINVQQDFASYFFGPEGGNFPNGEELAGFLVRLNNINWFSPEFSIDRDKLQENIDQFGEDIGLGSFDTHYLIVGNWEATHIRGINEMLDDWIDAIKVPVFSALEESGRWQAASVAMDAAEGCVNAAIHIGWQKTRDISGKAWGAARSAAANASIHAKYAVSSIVAFDAIEPNMRRTAAFQQSNPMDGLFKIYEMGLVPIGAKYGTRWSEPFIVFQPMN